jgi:hypothetical protein
MQFTKIYSTFSIGKPARREDFGLPNNWGRVRSWLTFRGEIKVKKSGMQIRRSLNGITSHI